MDLFPYKAYVLKIWEAETLLNGVSGVDCSPSLLKRWQCNISNEKESNIVSNLF